MPLLTQFGERMVLPPQDVVEDGRGERAVVEGGPVVAEGFEGPQEQFPLVVLLVASGAAEVAVEVGEESTPSPACCSWTAISWASTPP